MGVEGRREGEGGKEGEGGREGEREREREGGEIKIHTTPCVTFSLDVGLTMHATILAYMFTLVEDDKIASPLFDPTKVQAASNMDYIQKYVAELLKQAFPHLQE